MKFRSIFSFACTIGLVVLVSACGADAKRKDGRSVAAPEEGNGEGLGLVEGKRFLGEYQGSLLIWQDDPSVEGMASVARLSEAGVSNGVAKLKHIQEKVVPAKEEFDTAVAGMTSKIVREDIATRQDAMMEAVLWFPGYMGKTSAEIEGGLSEEEMAQANNLFAHYCEAKLWERATKENLLDETYIMARPTPSAMCERVYAKRGLLDPKAPACQGGKEPKNFFACLWHEGVKKTALWTTRYPAGSPVDEAFSSVSDDVLRYNFKHKRLHSELLRQRKGFIYEVEGEGRLEVDLSFVKADQGPEGLSVQKIISLIEKPGRSGEREDLRFVRLNGNPKRDKPNQELKLLLKLFHLLANSGYVNESRFNAILQLNSDVRGEIFYDLETRGKAAHFFPQIVGFKHVLALAEEVKGLGLAGAELLRPLATPDKGCPAIPENHDPAKPIEGNYECVGQMITSRTMDVIKASDVTKAIWQSSITVEKPEGEWDLVVKVTPNRLGGRSFVGCTHLQGKDRCSKRYRSEGQGVLNVAYDEKAARLVMMFDIEEGKKVGLVESPRAEFDSKLSYSEIPESRIQNSTVNVVANFVTIDGVLDMLTGGYRILCEDGASHGSFKLREINNPLEAEARKFKNTLEAL